MDSVDEHIELVSPFPMQKQFFIANNPGDVIQDNYDLQNARVPLFSISH